MSWLVYHSVLQRSRSVQLCLWRCLRTFICLCARLIKVGVGVDVTQNWQCFHLWPHCQRPTGAPMSRKTQFSIVCQLELPLISFPRLQTHKLNACVFVPYEQLPQPPVDKKWCESTPHNKPIGPNFRSMLLSVSSAEINPTLYTLSTYLFSKLIVKEIRKDSILFLHNLLKDSWWILVSQS